MKNRRIKTEAQEEDQMVRATKAAQELYDLRDTYFPTDPNEKMAKLRSQSDLALKLLDSIPLERRKVPDQEAMYEYLRGKILDIVPNYCKEAADHLFKAVKLNPSLVDAWFCLGNCNWKKGDLLMAKSCFTSALKKGRNKNILCRLSTLSRNMAHVGGNKVLHAKESIRYAWEAITLDVQYGESWYNLGTAYLTSFFVTGAVDRIKLIQSLKALKNAEKDRLLKSRPEIYYVTSKAYKYLEDFEKALIGFEAAAVLGPDHNISNNIQDIVNLLDTLDSALKEHARASKLSSVVSDLAYVKLNILYRRVPIDALLEGPNKGVAVITKVLSFNKHDSAPPMYHLICDSDKECFAVSVLGAQYDMIKTGDELILLEPFYYHYDFFCKGKEYNFKSIRLDFFNQMFVNGILLF